MYDQITYSCGVDTPCFEMRLLRLGPILSFSYEVVDDRRPSGYSQIVIDTIGL